MINVFKPFQTVSQLRKNITTKHIVIETLANWLIFYSLISIFFFRQYVMKIFFLQKWPSPRRPARLIPPARWKKIQSFIRSCPVWPAILRNAVVRRKVPSAVCNSDLARGRLTIPKKSNLRQVTIGMCTSSALSDSMFFFLSWKVSHAIRITAHVMEQYFALSFGKKQFFRDHTFKKIALIDTLLT